MAKIHVENIAIIKRKDENSKSQAVSQLKSKDMNTR